MKEKVENAVAWIESLIEDGYQMQIGLSGGKDSSCVLQLAIMAIMRCMARGIEQPTHVIASADTTIEQPVMHWFLMDMLDQLNGYIKEQNLPLEVRITTPYLSSQFMTQIVGRGKLPSYPGGTRDCSVDYKVIPLQRLSAQLGKEGAGQKRVSLLGTRVSESSSRGLKMSDRGDGNYTLVEQSNQLTNAVISDWSTDDVWYFLASCGDGKDYPSFWESFDRTVELYRDANEGACVINTGEKGNHASCGSRFGCVTCMISGDRDKSMESLLEDPKYSSYLTGLNDFRKFLLATRWDFSRREMIGRTRSDAGFVRIGPDIFNMKMRVQLLSYLLTLDAIEKERAEEVEAHLITGQIEDTPWNRQMSVPQFEMISLEQLMAIQFHWSINRDGAFAGRAFEVWNRVHNHGQRYDIPSVFRDESGEEITEFPKEAFPEPRWVKVDSYDFPGVIGGLRDLHLEALLEQKGEPTAHYFRDKADLPQKSIHHQTANHFQVNNEKALIMMLWYEENYIEIHQYEPEEMAKLMLSKGVIVVKGSDIATYDDAVRRAQYWDRLWNQYNVSNLYKKLHSESITDKEHVALISSITNPQLDMFAA